MSNRRTGIARRAGSLLGRFRRDRRGASVVEFAFVAVPFLGLLGAILETSFVFLNSTGLEAAVQEAARNIMTGEAQAANVGDATTFVNTYLCPSAPQTRILPSFIDCSKLVVDVRTASSFASVDTSNDFSGNTYTRQFCPGGPQTIVIVRVAYPMPVYIPIIAGFASIAPVTAGLVNYNGTGLKHLLVGTAVFQTEPFNQSSYNKPSNC